MKICYNYYHKWITKSKLLEFYRIYHKKQKLETGGICLKKEKKKEWIAILDFGSQYTQLIARRIREAKVYLEIFPYHVDLDKLKMNLPKGIILSGGPASVYENRASVCDKKIFELGIPILY